MQHSTSAVISAWATPKIRAFDRYALTVRVRIAALGHLDRPSLSRSVCATVHGACSIGHYPRDFSTVAPAATLDTFIADIGEHPLMAYFVENLADTISGDNFGGRLTTTRCAIVDPGLF
jgi:hypothetical protein